MDNKKGNRFMQLVYLIIAPLVFIPLIIAPFSDLNTFLEHFLMFIFMIIFLIATWVIDLKIQIEDLTRFIDENKKK